MISNRVTVAAEVVRQRIEALKAVFPELCDDADLLADTVAGETDFDTVIDRILDAFLDAVSMKESVAQRMSALKERGERFDRKCDALKGLAYELMQTSGQRIITLPQATLSIRAGSRSVVVDEVADLPQGFVKFDPLPLKAEIKKALEAGQDVPGARLVTGDETLSIRTK